MSVFHYSLINPLNVELNPICHLLALLGAHHILHVSRIRVKHRVICFLIVYSFSYVLLTVHPCIILKIKPTWCTIFLSMFISFFYMFRETMCVDDCLL